MNDLQFEWSSGRNVSLGKDDIMRWVGRDLENTGFLSSARVGYDLGSGLGDSAVALNDLCPNLDVLHAVDKNKAVSDKNRNLLGDKLVPHDKTSIAGFLEESAEGNIDPADIVMMVSVPAHRLVEQDYENLALSISQDGILIELGDTGLDDEMMEINFTLLPCGDQNGRRYWKRK